MDEKKVESIIFGLKETISEQKAEIERLAKVEIDLIGKIADKSAEIERLTEELDLANETIDRNNKRYEKVSIERQKALDRVDYLEDALLEKIRRNEELITAIKQAEQKAVKDTAKEIFEKLLGYIGSQQQFCIVDEEHKTLIDCDKLFDFVGNLAKEKGVGVE